MNRTVTFLVTLVAVLIAGQSASAQEYDVSFKSANGSFVVAENGGGGVVNANREEIGAWERFTLIDLNGGRLRSGDPVNIRAANGMYMVAENGGGSVVNANRRAAALWEKFAIIKVARETLVET